LASGGLQRSSVPDIHPLRSRPAVGDENKAHPRIGLIYAFRGYVLF
jgi:hypothetical protein